MHLLIIRSKASAEAVLLRNIERNPHRTPYEIGEATIALIDEHAKRGVEAEAYRAKFGVKK